MRTPPSRRAVLLSIFAATCVRAQSCPPDAGPTERRIVACIPQASSKTCLALARGMGCAVVRELRSINAVVIDVPVSRVSIAEDSLAAEPQVELYEADRTVNWLKGVRTSPAFEFPNAARDLLKGIAGLKSGAAQDPEQPWGIRRVNAAAAWRTPQGQGKGVRVAVIDTGVSRAHPDLAAAVVGGFNALNPSKPDSWDDDEGHGSHVAGTIAAKRDGQGVVGVAPLVSLYAVKVLDKDGNGAFSDIIAGIEWAVEHKIQVANMSLGADEGSEALKRAVAAAAKSGLTIVASAGNSAGPVSYPAAYPEVIAVGASDSNDEAAPFSSHGRAVAFIAPGVKVKSIKLGGGYTEMSGTSMASPHVAGLAALAVARGARGPKAVRAALNIAALLIAPLRIEFQGAGMIDAAKIR